MSINAADVLLFRGYKVYAGVDGLFNAHELHKRLLFVRKADPSALGFPDWMTGDQATAYLNASGIKFDRFCLPGRTGVLWAVSEKVQVDIPVTKDLMVLNLHLLSVTGAGAVHKCDIKANPDTIYGWTEDPEYRKIYQSMLRSHPAEIAAISAFVRSREGKEMNIPLGASKAARKVYSGVSWPEFVLKVPRLDLPVKEVIPFAGHSKLVSLDVASAYLESNGATATPGNHASDLEITLITLAKRPK